MSVDFAKLGLKDQSVTIEAFVRHDPQAAAEMPGWRVRAGLRRKVQNSLCSGSN